MVLRAWVEPHDDPLRVRVIHYNEDAEATSAVVSSESDVLALVGEWLAQWSTYGHRHRGGA